MSPRPRLRAAFLTLALAALAPAAQAATIVIVNTDGPGEGFNDGTAVAPVGGNPGTTRGAQRLFVFQQAATLWGNILPSSVTIRVNAQFNALTCNATSAVLGSAGAATLVSDFANNEFPNTWYPVALGNRLAGTDLAPANDDINANFNSALDNGTCLGGITWYYGVDGNEPANQVELLPVVLHELGHGLGFAQYASLTTGAPASGRTDIYQRFLYDNTTGLHWNQMTNAQRVASAINTGNVSWDGTAVKVMAPVTLNVRTELRVTAPAAIAGTKQFGTASFGPSPSAQTISGQVVLVDDGVAPNSDGCTALVNGGAINGKIALIDRGTCNFTAKADFAQAAGAIAVIIGNNAAGAPPAMGGDDPDMLIPVVSITQTDANAMKAQLGAGVFVTIGPNPAFLAGCDDAGRPLLYTPNPVEQGSSISHWDTSADPNLLMEPFINDDLSSNVDLTRYAFEDIGWFQPRTTNAPPGPAAVRFAVYPNPFTVTTRIDFELPQAGRASVDIYDVAGRIVKQLAAGDMPAGPHAIAWDGTDDSGVKVRPGVYFYRLVTPTLVASKRAVKLSGL